MVEFIVILVILFFAGKYLLFNVRVNSVAFMIFAIVAISLKPALIPVSTLSVSLLVVNIIDCIRDIIIADEFYGEMSDGIDAQFAVKSLITVALLLLGIFVWDGNLIYTFILRVVFLCVINPVIEAKVRNDVEGKIEIGYPLPYNKWQYSHFRKERYYYKNLVERLFNNGTLVVNVETVFEERDASNKKLADNYPTDMLSKLARVLQNNKEEKERMKVYEKALSENTVYKHTAYVSSAFFEQYASKIARVLKTKNKAFSPWKIKELAELQDLNLTAPNGYVGDVKWSEYFIIKSLRKLVHDGVINDFDCSDDPLDNHVYGVEMTSHDASSDPRLSLDDD